MSSGKRSRTITSRLRWRAIATIAATFVVVSCGSATLRPDAGDGGGAGGRGGSSGTAGTGGGGGGAAGTGGTAGSMAGTGGAGAIAGTGGKPVGQSLAVLALAL